MVFNSAAATFLVASHKQWVLFKVNLCTLVLTLALNWVLIPPLSFVGASIATVGTQTLGAILYTSILLRSFHQAFPSAWKRIGLVSVVFMVVVIFSTTLPTLVGMTLAILVYPLLLFVFRFASWNDVKALWTAIQTSGSSKG
jgi:O-antigen/teichoic acid export membrane protein